MLDPLDALYLPVDSVTPDQEFAADLRDRLRRKVFDTMHDNSTGEEMSDTQTTNALTPYLAVRDAMAAIRWYTEVFDATLRGEPIQWHGRIGHAELTVFGARLMLSDESPEYRIAAPTVDGTHQFTLHLDVSNVDELVRKAGEAGATVERVPRDEPYGRAGVIIDPFGHRWMIMNEVRAS